MTNNKNAEELEQKYVKDVYNTIASHFSSTRYKPWPAVVNFLNSLADHSKVADIGCGNGKYFTVNNKLNMIGCDTSEKLVEICQKRGFNVQLGDTLQIPFLSNTYDAVLSIAVFHHLSTEVRRLQAIKELLRILKPNGQLMLCAWSYEQSITSRRQFNSQDVLTSWHLPYQFTNKNHPRNNQLTWKHLGQNNTTTEQIKLNVDQNKDQILQRYCHVYEKNELDNLFKQFSNIKILKVFLILIIIL